MDHFLSCACLFSNDCSLCQADIKLASVQLLESSCSGVGQLGLTSWFHEGAGPSHVDYRKWETSRPPTPRDSTESVSHLQAIGINFQYSFLYQFQLPGWTGHTTPGPNSFCSGRVSCPCNHISLSTAAQFGHPPGSLLDFDLPKPLENYLPWNERERDISFVCLLAEGTDNKRSHFTMSLNINFMQMRFYFMMRNC